jgi:hypothetical protein
MDSPRSYAIWSVTGFLGLLVLMALACGGKAEKAETGRNVPSDTAETSVSQDSVTITLTGRDSVSVFALLQQNHKVDYVSTAMGVFVRGIDGLESGAGDYWVYTVNDTAPDIASDRVLTRTGDRVVWHYQKSR